MMQQAHVLTPSLQSPIPQQAPTPSSACPAQNLEPPIQFIHLLLGKMILTHRVLPIIYAHQYFQMDT